MSSPWPTDDLRHDTQPPGPLEARTGGLTDDYLRQEFFVEWEVPQRPQPAAAAGAQDRPDDLRGVVAFLVDDLEDDADSFVG